MRRRSVVAIAALIAAFALAGLPAPAGSTSPTLADEPVPAAFTSVTIPADAQARGAQGLFDGSSVSAGHVTPDTTFTEPGRAPSAPSARPRVDQPPTPAGSAWKPPRYTLTGYATFYDNGTTAMRLPRGTVVRICGKGGCLVRTVTDYGPVKKVRIVDMYRPDFFKVCGCASWSGTTWVTVSVY